MVVEFDAFLHYLSGCVVAAGAARVELPHISFSLAPHPPFGANLPAATALHDAKVRAGVEEQTVNASHWPDWRRAVRRVGDRAVDNGFDNGRQQDRRTLHRLRDDVLDPVQVRCQQLLPERGGYAVNRPRFDALMQVGAADGIPPLGLRAMDCLRIEKFYRNERNDPGTEFSLLEAAMERF